MVERGERRELQGVMEDIWVVFIDRLAVRDASTRVTMWMWSTSLYAIGWRVVLGYGTLV
jgi:hypothetical protein